MGRPREHDERTASALIDAAERIAEAEGVDALSVRRVAQEGGTTTRAVYSLFGAKEGLLAALGRRAFQVLGEAVRALPETDDPAADLVTAGVRAFRPFATGHPALLDVGFRRAGVAPDVAAAFRADQRDAFGALVARAARLGEAGGLGGRAPQDAAQDVHALCEGLALREARGGMPEGREDQAWADALSALVAGFAAAPAGASGV